jgi:hypothetical protein
MSDLASKRCRERTLSYLVPESIVRERFIADSVVLLSSSCKPRPDEPLPFDALAPSMWRTPEVPVESAEEGAAGADAGRARIFGRETVVGISRTARCAGNLDGVYCKQRGEKIEKGTRLERTGKKNRNVKPESRV